MDIYITGTGVVSALGRGVKANMDRLKSGISGLGHPKHLPHADRSLFAGEFDATNDALKAMLGIQTGSQVPRTALLGMLAAREALGTTVLKDGLKTGFINGTTVGGMDLTENHFRKVYLENDDSHFKLTATHDLGTVTNLIAGFLGIFDYRNTISTACSSSANSIMLGARMIRAGLLDRAVAGGCDALSRFTISGFQSLMIYSDEVCRPFDAERKGLNLGEGAGFLLLESEHSLKRSGNVPLAKLTGWHNANDAFHQTGTSPEGAGARKAMQGALASAGLTPADIKYINAHGTATQNNDASEGNAIKELFENPVFSSTKGFTGHTLGAAGGVEAVFSVLSIVNRCVFPNVNHREPMEDFPLEPVKKFKEGIEIRHVLSNSFGFGGNSTSLIFSAC